MVTFEQARQTVLGKWPDYDIAPFGYEGEADWFVLLAPLTVGGRIAAIDKTTGKITWINENSDIYTQEFPVGEVS